MDLPGARPADVTGPFRLERRTFVKMFSDRLSEGRASVEHPASGDRLVVSFDTGSLPHLGFLASQGHDSLGDGHFANEFLLALEPTTGIGDAIPSGDGRGDPRVLVPGEELTFWIRLAVEAL
jgi:galactose mutarotase-like enzyme